MKANVKKVSLIILFIINVCIIAVGQTLTYTLQNEVQTANNILIFDLYLLNTNASNPIEIAGIQAGITLNSAIVNGGTITASLVSGYSDLVSAEQPTAITYTSSTYCIKIAARSGPGAGYGTIMSTTAPGTRYCRVMLTNTVAFASAAPNLTFSFNVNPYATKINAYISALSTPLTLDATNTYSLAANLILNNIGTITTDSVKNITTTNATAHITISSIASPYPTSYGVCYSSTNTTPTTSDNIVNNGSVSVNGSFSASLSSLTPGTTYYVRAFQTNTQGTSYGNTITFMTENSTTSVPTVTTQAVSNITSSTATGNGSITNLGNPASITDYGVCWSSSNTTPTISDSYISNGTTTSTGDFTSSITGLTKNTVYYVRAYATNSTGTAYGSVVTFDNTHRWVGSISTDWNTTGNWSTNAVPATGDDIYFDSSPQNNCVLDQDRSIGSLTNAQATYLTLLNGHKLTLSGALNLTNSAQINASTAGSTIVFAGSSAQSIPAAAFYNNQVYNLTVNNANNVTLNGSLNLLGTLTATSGLLDAVTQTPTFIYAGTAAQSIDTSLFVNNQIYNLTIANAAGVTVNTILNITNNLTLNSSSLFTIAATKSLTVNGSLTNNAGSGGFVIASTSSGTGSLIHNTNSVPATVNRYIGGTADAWHFLSSPVAAQSISGVWTPTGTHGDGTGYDLYVWDEPSSCWIYNLNTTVSPTWTSIHPQSYFVPAKGYLYAIQASSPTKAFIGNLNNGTVSYSITTSASTTYQGFNLLGNPYPSSIDWKMDAGFTRNMLYSNGGGYDVWTWSPTASNYGVYNSAETDDVGTNNVNRYIAPMQGFFVRASSAGTFSVNNTARSNAGAGAWLKSKISNLVRVAVNSEENVGSDEVKLYFGYGYNQNGAIKMFSQIQQAPSLYLTNNDGSYSIRYLTNVQENHYVPLAFKAGKEGNYTITCKYDESTTGTVYLEDRLASTTTDLSNRATYSFKSDKTDDSNRFVLHFGSIGETTYLGFNAKVYTIGQYLIVDLQNIPSGMYNMKIYDISGHLVSEKTFSGGSKLSYPLSTHGMYIITLQGSCGTKNFKAIY